MKTTLLVCAALAGFSVRTLAAPLTESTFTEIIKSVSTLQPDSTAAAAKMQDVVKAPTRVRTGAESRAELTAGDKTITRVGANTVFSFENAGRVLNLESGSLLFHSPKGAGGGTIKSGGASAAVLGTTIIVVATADGGFKLIVLEGQGKATLPTGKSITLEAGQLVFVLPGGKGFSRVYDINLEKLTAASQLLLGFSRELPSLPAVQTAVGKQKKLIAKGRATDTGVSVDNVAAGRLGQLGNGLAAVDHNSYGTAVHAPLTPIEIFRIGGQPGGPKGTSGGAGGASVVPVAPIP
jgi:hypothetical protein